MANTWFQFKHFIVHQSNSAFKVGTDGVLLGAWVNCHHQTNLLDVGTGTGLIALMLAQKNPTAQLTAIEIDTESALVAASNFNLSAWHNRIALKTGDYLAMEFPSKFHHVVSNLPFFNNDLKNPNARKLTARHDDSLPFEAFLEKSKKLLDTGGNISFILPYSRLNELKTTIEQQQLHIARMCAVKSQASKPFHRILMTLNTHKVNCEETELILQTDSRKYTDEAWALFSEYYLHQ